MVYETTWEEKLFQMGVGDVGLQGTGSRPGSGPGLPVINSRRDHFGRRRRAYHGRRTRSADRGWRGSIPDIEMEALPRR